MPSSSQDKRPRRGRNFYGPGPYVEREADSNLLASLLAGEYALIFAPRGSGKTSLRIRASEELALEGVRIAVVDLGAIGAETRADAFYASLVIEAARTLGLESEAKKAWRRSKGPPQMRLRACLREVLLEPSTKPLVLFIDELELVRALGPARDDFFAALRAMAEARGHDPIWARLSVCLIGALSRDELVSDPGRGGFDLPAREFAPRDFSREQSQAFAPILDRLGVDTKALLDALYDWTSGNPALMQWLCGDLLLRDLSRGQEATAVEAVVRETFLRRGPELDPLLGDTARRLRRDLRDPYRTRLLAAYERVLRDEIIDLRGRQLGSEGAIIVSRLKVAGLVAASAGGKLRVRNRIIERVFDRNWVRRALAGRPVSDALDRWETGGRRAAHLLRGEALRAATEWIEGRPDISAGERDFVFASERARARRLRGLLGAGSALSLGLGLGLGVVSWQYRPDPSLEVASEQLETPPDTTVVPTLDDEPPTLASATAPEQPSLPDWAQEAVGASYFDAEAQGTIRGLEKRLETLELRLAIETAARAELLAPDPALRNQGLELALAALSAWVEAGTQLADAPTPLTRGLTANLPSAGDSTSLSAHDGPVERLVLAANGTRLATASAGEARVWERDTGRRIANLNNLGGSILHLALSPAGRHVAALSVEGSLTVWDLEHGRALGPAPLGVSPGVPMPLAPIASLSIDDGGHVTLTRRDGSLDTIAPAAGNVSTRIQASALAPSLPFELAVVADPSLVADTHVVLAQGDVIELWSVAEGLVQASITAPELLGPTNPPIQTMLASPGASEVILLATGRGEVTVWDISRGVLRAIADQPQAIHTLALSSDGELLATGGDDGIARVWNIESGERLANLPAHDDALTRLAFTPDGASLLVGDRSGQLRTHPLVLGGEATLPLHAAALGSTGLAATVHCDDASLELRWSGGQTSARWALARPISEAGISVDGSRLVLRYPDGELAMFSGAAGPTSEPITHIADQVLDLALSSDGQLLAVASEARTVALLGNDGRAIATLSGHEAPIDHLALSADGTRLVSADRSRVVRVWDPGTAALLSTFTLASDPTQLAIDTDHVLVIDERGSARVWSIPTREPLAELELGVEGITGLALSPGAQWFALGREHGADDQARVELWRADTPEAIASFRARGPVTALRFTDAGQTLLAVDGRGQLARWPTIPEVWVAEACAVLSPGSVIPSVCEPSESGKDALASGERPEPDQVEP